MSWFSAIETDRLLVREYAQGDAEARRLLMAEAFGSTDTQERTQLWLDWTIASYREHGDMYQPPYGDYAIVRKDTGELIGAVGLVPQGVPWGVLPDMRPPDEPYHTLMTPEFGLFWAIRTAHKGHGYAPEAAQAFLHQFIFGALSAWRAVATTEHDNVASQRVMQKIGMTLYRNPGDEPFWFNVVGVVDNPALARTAL